MRHASLFSGIGGFDLAAQWMGWENVFQVEIDDFCQKVLSKNFPNTKRYGDIKQFDGTEYAGQIDILTGGFPCQPFSIAGQQKGKVDNRYLWPAMLRVIGEVKPRWIVGENVTGIINLALDEVLTSLENQGYHTETYIIPACAVNAPHRRDRVWIVAHSNGWSRQEHELPAGRNVSEGWTNEGGIPANTHAQGLPVWIQPNEREAGRTYGAFQGCESSRTHSAPSWSEFPTQSPISGGDDGLPNRVDRIKALGNSVVPQVVFEIFKAIDSLTPR